LQPWNGVFLDAIAAAPLPEAPTRRFRDRLSYIAFPFLLPPARPLYLVLHPPGQKRFSAHVNHVDRIVQDKGELGFFVSSPDI